MAAALNGAALYRVERAVWVLGDGADCPGCGPAGAGGVATCRGRHEDRRAGPVEAMPGLALVATRRCATPCQASTHALLTLALAQYR